MEDKFVNGILLSAIGDALGWITEFEKSKESVLSKYGIDKIESFYDWKKFVGGRFNGYLDCISAGSYSDDTQLMLCVARSIKINKEVDNNYFAKAELPTWLNYSRGAGRTIKNAAIKIERKSASWFNNFFSYSVGDQKFDYREAGANGAAMRILPIALVNYKNFENLKYNIFYNSIVTHGHPRAIVGAIIYGIAIKEMLGLSVHSFSYEEYLTKIGTDFETKLQINFKSSPELNHWISEWNKDTTLKFEDIYKETISESLSALRSVFKYIKNNEEPSIVLTNLGCLDSASKGSGISTVMAGIYFASKYYNQPEYAIIQAVNAIGADTDSIAAFTGGILGVLYEHKIVPEKWKNVQDYQYLEKIGSTLFRIAHDMPIGISDRTPNTDSKTFKEIKSDKFFENEKVFYYPLGNGIIDRIERHNALTKGKYNLVLDISFNSGQTCKFAKLLERS